ncbi:MAG: DNA-binding ferritin-like protein (Dps family) [Paraglaciecola sp.]|jgi:DNA-binding ferritin-like protein (Dps family)
MQTKVRQAINSIENLLQDGTLYYSTEENRYLMGFHGGLGNFELFRLPKAWAGVFISQDVEPASLSAAVTGNLKLDGQTSDVVEDQIVQISKVRSAELYGQCHDGTLTSALLFASKHHQHQKRKASGEPYINHLIEVLQILIHFEPVCDENIKIAAVLHDVVEDTTAPIESLEFLFGDDVANLVAQLTCADAKDSDDKKQKLIQQISTAGNRAQQIKLADVTSNAMLIPTSWTKEKRKSYLAWCIDVAHVCSNSSENLFMNFLSKISWLSK